MRKIYPFFKRKIRLNDCTGCGKRLVIMPKGYLYACEYMTNKKGFLGSLNNDWNEIFNSKNYNIFNNSVQFLDDTCNECIAKIFCGGGCRYDAYFDNSDLVIWLTMVTAFERDPKKQESEEDITKMILQFHLESALGLAKASPIATLEYKLLNLEKEDLLTKSEQGEQIIREAWKEVKLWKQSLDVGREILGLLIDHGNFPTEFSSKVPTHFEYIINNYQKDPIRLARVKERLETKNGEPSETEIYDEIIVDYLIQFYNNYILRKKKVDPNSLTIPKEKPSIDLTPKEREIVNRLDEGLQRGIRTQQRSKTIEILESLLPAMYRQGLNSGLEALDIAEALLYGILNLNGIELSREEAKKILLKHLDRMKISLTKTSKKLLDSALCQALSIEFKDCTVT